MHNSFNPGNDHKIDGCEHHINSQSKEVLLLYIMICICLWCEDGGENVELGNPLQMDETNSFVGDDCRLFSDCQKKKPDSPTEVR